MNDTRRPLIFLSLVAMLASACSSAADGGNATSGGAGAAGTANAGGAGGATGGPGEHRNLIAASPSHRCALRNAGLYCWGENVFGALGNGNTETSDVPVLAAAGANIVELAAATGRTCVRRSSGEVACWGANEQGQIGNGTREPSMVPVAAMGISDAIAIAIDDGSTCALRADRSVWCWGLSSVESPTEGGTLLPKQIPGLMGIEEIRNGMMGTYCARNAAKQIWCWRVKDQVWTAPMEMPAMAGAKTIALAAWDEICGIAESGEIRCHNFDSGKTVPLSSSENSVAVRGAGGLSACGKNGSGQWQCWNVLPPLLEAVGSTPVPIRTEMPIEDLVIGGFHVCGLRADRSVACADAEKIGITPLPEYAELTVVPGLPL